VSELVSPLEFLQSVYSDRQVPLHVRVKAACEAAQYVHPKLSIAANYNAGFASRLEAMMSARGLHPVIDARPLPQGEG
jgi:hypothetical protein